MGLMFVATGDNAYNVIQRAGHAMLFVAFSAPFMLALVTCLFADPAHRAGLWLGGIVQVVLTALPVTGYIYGLWLPSVLLLGAAGLRAWWETGWLHSGRVVATGLLAALIGTGSMVALFVFQHDGACWQRIREANSVVHYERYPLNTQPGVTLNRGAQVESDFCRENIHSTQEVILSLGIVIGGFATATSIGAGNRLSQSLQSVKSFHKEGINEPTNA
jgi:hypothetical protein